MTASIERPLSGRPEASPRPNTTSPASAAWFIAGYDTGENVGYHRGVHVGFRIGFRDGTDAGRTEALAEVDRTEREWFTAVNRELASNAPDDSYAELCRRRGEPARAARQSAILRSVGLVDAREPRREEARWLTEAEIRRCLDSWSQVPQAVAA